jgi:hypothetical protein
MSQKDKNQQWWSFFITVLVMMVWVSRPVFGETEKEISSQEVEAIIPQIEAAEKGLHNIKVDAESWVEERALPSDPWQRTPTYFSCTAWMDGQFKGKVRMDVHKEVLKWRDGAAPYAGRSYTVGFDGTNTKFVERTAGPSDKQFPKKEGQVSPGMRGFMGSCIGWRFTTNFFSNENEAATSFSQFFRLAISPEAIAAKAFEFVYEEKDDVLCLKFSPKPAEWSRQSWWFDPNRGFALMAYLYANKIDGVEHVISDIRVNKLQEIAPGVWWPIEATEESGPREPNGPYKKIVYRALKVIANDPNFNENIFTLTFPKGYRVDDKVTGKKYIVDSNLVPIAEPNK